MSTCNHPGRLHRLTLLVLLPAVLLAAGGARADRPADGSTGPLSPQDPPLRIASSATTDDIAAVWTAALHRLHPSGPAPELVRSRYPTDALEALIGGRVDAALCAREPFASERAAARRAGWGELRFIPIATGSRASRGGTHAIAIFVHGSNPLESLSIAQLREVLAADGRVRTWGELGVTGALAAERIVVHGQPVRRASGNPPGIVNFLTGRVLGLRPWREDLVAHDDEAGGLGALDAIVQAVARDPRGIGWSGFDYGVPGAKALALRSGVGEAAFAGTAEEIAARQYPLSRFVYLCLPERATRAAQELARVILQPGSQALLTRSASGFMPLTEADRRAALARVESPLVPPREAGYLTPDGRIRVVGYNDMREMMSAWTEAFSQDHGGFRFELDLPATRAAVDAVAGGRAAFGPLGAELSPAQRARFRELAGVDPVQIRVAHASLDPRALSGPLAVFVHASSPRREISLPELADIFGGGGSLPGLEPTGLAADTALGIYFRERVLRGAAFVPTFRAHAQSEDVVRHVAANPGAIGFAAAMRARDGVRALALAPAAGQPAVELTGATLVSNAYPLGRHLWVLIRPPVEPWGREFLQFVLSADGRRLLDEGSLGYRALSVEDCAVEVAKLK